MHPRMVTAIPKRMQPEMARSTRLFKTAHSVRNKDCEIRQRPPESYMWNWVTLTQVPGLIWSTAFWVGGSSRAYTLALVHTLVRVILGRDQMFTGMWPVDFHVISVPAQVQRCTRVRQNQNITTLRLFSGFVTQLITMCNSTRRNLSPRIVAPSYLWKKPQTTRSTGWPETRDVLEMHNN